tara:strand:- start:9181 stop:10767 length:1587 start_codon:yes stop_codon:yes gene_type:complete
MKNIFCILFSIISISSFGQDIDINIQTGDFYRDKMINTTLSFSESDNNGGIIAVRNAEATLTSNPYPKEYFIEHYDKNLKLIKEITITNDNMSQFKGLMIKNGKINLIEFEYDKENMRINVNILESNIDDLKFEKKLLISLNQDNFKAYFGSSGLDFLNNEFKFINKNPIGHIIFSEKKEFFTIQFDHIEKKNNVHYFLVYNSNFEKEYEVKHWNKNQYTDFNNIKLSDYDGTLFFLQKVFENNSQRTEKNGKTNYHYELFKYNALANTQINIKEDTKFISSLFILPKINDVSLVGFYSSKDDSYIEGICHYNINLNDLKTKEKSFEPLSKQFFIDKYKKGISEKSKKLRNIKVINLIIDKAENIIISAEEYTLENPNLDTQNNTLNKNTSYSEFLKEANHHYDDILSIKINNEGKIIWSRNINKAQTGIKKSSYISTYQNGNAYYFINGNLKKLKNDRIVFLQSGLSKSDLYLISIDDNGFKYKKIMDDNKSNIWYDLRNGVISKDRKSIILQGIKKRSKQIIKIDI